MEFENRTPHSVTIFRADGTALVIPKTIPAARVETRPGVHLGEVNGVPIYGQSQFIGLVNLPDKRDGTVIIVSQITALAVSALHPERDDVVYPGGDPYDAPVRDATTGRIVVVRRLIRA